MRTGRPYIRGGHFHCWNGLGGTFLARGRTLLPSLPPLQCPFLAIMPLPVPRQLPDPVLHIDRNTLERESGGPEGRRGREQKSGGESTVGDRTVSHCRSRSSGPQRRIYISILIATPPEAACNDPEVALDPPSPEAACNDPEVAHVLN